MAKMRGTVGEETPGRALVEILGKAPGAISVPDEMMVLPAATPRQMKLMLQRIPSQCPKVNAMGRVTRKATGIRKLRNLILDKPGPLPLPRSLRRETLVGWQSYGWYGAGWGHGGGWTPGSWANSGSWSWDGNGAGSGAGSGAGGQDGSGSTSTARSTAPTPSRTSTSPTTLASSHATPPPREGGKGPSEKLVIPCFNGEGEGGELGSSARSYLRQVAAWQRMTKLGADQQALVLHQHLEGAAWVNAEALDVEKLATPSGVEYLKEWIRQHYLDIEITQISRSLSDLFRKLRRKNTQTFRDYVAEFNRLLARVIECGCLLPEVATAWIFVDRANLDETTEVSLLASVGNQYDLKRLQQAAIILDRNMRKPWEPRKTHSVHHSEDVAGDSDDDGASDEAFLEDLTRTAATCTSPTRRPRHGTGMPARLAVWTLMR